MRRLLGALLLLGGLWMMAAPPAHGQYCGSVGGNTTMLSGMYTGGIYPTYPSTYGGFYGYPYYGGEAPTRPTADTIPTRQTSRTTTRSSARAATIRRRPTERSIRSSATPTTTSPRWITGIAGGLYTGYQYGGLPFYGGQSGAPLNPYAPYPLAGGNYGSAADAPAGDAVVRWRIRSLFFGAVPAVVLHRRPTVLEPVLLVSVKE